MGWAEDQRWTLERVTTLIGRLFHVRCTLRGAPYQLHRIGFPPAHLIHHHSPNRRSGEYPGL